MLKKSPARPQAAKGAYVVPEWAKKVKAYRDAAGKTQVEVERALKATVNTLSLVENGHRNFTPAQRSLFFELVGKPEDTSIPATVRAVAPAAKKAAKPTRRGKGLTAPKGPQVKASVQAIPAPAAPDIQEVAPVSAEAVPVAVSAQPGAKAARKRTPKPRGRKPLETPAVQPAAEQRPMAPRTPAPVQNLSPVKEAVLRDLNRILSNPGLSDDQAKRLHGLFTSLAVNALLGA